MKKLIYILLVCAFASCVGGVVTDAPANVASDSDTIQTIVTIVDTSTVADTTLMTITPQQADSLRFRLTHHYSENFNFLVQADSLMLVPREGDLVTDTCRVYRGDVVAVAEIRTLPGDSIDSVWVKVASNQFSMGWIPERELLRGTTPDSTISILLYTLSGSRAVWMSALVVLGLATVFIGRRRHQGKPVRLKFPMLRSPYPSLFLILVGVMASLYASVQNFVPEFWQEYYFHPTLNPLVLPPLMAVLVVIMWLVIITFIAVVDEAYSHLYILPAVAYLTELLGLAMLTYLVISWTTLLFVGYVLLALLVYVLGKRVAGFFTPPSLPGE